MRRANPKRLSALDFPSELMCLVVEAWSRQRRVEWIVALKAMKIESLEDFLDFKTIHELKLTRAVAEEGVRHLTCGLQDAVHLHAVLNKHARFAEASIRLENDLFLDDLWTCFLRVPRDAWAFFDEANVLLKRVVLTALSTDSYGCRVASFGPPVPGVYFDDALCACSATSTAMWFGRRRLEFDPRWGAPCRCECPNACTYTFACRSTGETPVGMFLKTLERMRLYPPPSDWGDPVALTLHRKPSNVKSSSDLRRT